MAADTDRPAKPESRSQTWAAIIMLAVVTLMTFANSAPDALVFDDKVFVGPDAEHRLEHPGEAFTRDVWNMPGFHGGLYRPLLMLDFELESRMFGNWRTAYHVTNILLHLGTTLLLFGFLRFLLRRFHDRPEGATLAALAAALVFAVHPIHTEVVNSVFNRSSMFVTLLSVAGLWWLLARIEKRTLLAWLGLGLCYAAAILFKESALVLPGIAFAFVVLLFPGSLSQRIRRGLPVFWLLIPIVVYFWARMRALADGGAGDVLADGETAIALFESVRLVGGQSILVGISLFGQGMKMLLWPYPLQLYHGFPEPPESAMYIIGQCVVAALAVIRLMRGRPALAVGLAFFYLALLPSIRLFSLDGSYPHMAERYLYFPSVGLAIVLAFGAHGLRHALGARTVAIPALLLTVLMAGVCWERNQEWRSEVFLFETEYQYGQRGNIILQLLSTRHRIEGRLYRVVEICEENTDRYAELPQFVNTCVYSMIQTGRTDQAIAALEISARQDASWISARSTLARIHAGLGERQKAADYFVEIVNHVEEPALKAFFMGELLSTIYSRNRERLLEAQAHYRRALRLDPALQAAQQRLDALERDLDAMEAETDLDEMPPPRPPER